MDEKIRKHGKTIEKKQTESWQVGRIPDGEIRVCDGKILRK